MWILILLLCPEIVCAQTKNQNGRGTFAQSIQSKNDVRTVRQQVQDAHPDSKIVNERIVSESNGSGPPLALRNATPAEVNNEMADADARPIINMDPTAQKTFYNYALKVANEQNGSSQNGNPLPNPDIHNYLNNPSADNYIKAIQAIYPNMDEDKILFIDDPNQPYATVFKNSIMRYYCEFLKFYKDPEKKTNYELPPDAPIVPISGRVFRTTKAEVPLLEQAPAKPAKPDQPKPQKTYLPMKFRHMHVNKPPKHLRCFFDLNGKRRL